MALAPGLPAEKAGPGQGDSAEPRRPLWSPRQLRALTAIAVGGAALVRAWILLSGSVSAESLTLVGGVASGSPVPGTSALERAAASVALATEPLEFWPLACVLLALWLAYSGAALATCWAITASGATRLTLLVLLLYAPFSVPGMSTWPAGAEQTTFAIGCLLLILGAARLHHGSSLAHAWPLYVGVPVAMLGASPGAWRLVWVAAAWGVFLAWWPGVSGPADISGSPEPAGLRLRRGLLSSALLLAPAIAWSLAFSSAPVASLPRDLGGAAAFVGESVGSGLLPGLAGGPVSWLSGIPLAPSADAPLWVTVVGAQVLLLGLVSALFLTRRGLLAWGAGLLATGIALAFFALGQPAVVAGTGAELLGLAAAPSLLLPAAAASLAAIPDGSAGLAVPPRARALAGVVAVDIFLAVSAVTTFAWNDARVAFPGEAYLDNARVALMSASPEIPLLPQVVPPAIVNAAYAPLNRTDVVFAPLAHRPAFADWTPLLQVLDEQGDLRPATVEGINVPVTCTDWAPAVGALPDLAAFGYVVEVALAQPDNGGFTIRLGDGEPVVVPPDPTRTRVFAQVVGGGNTLELTPLGADPLCVASVRIGQVQPVADGLGEANP